MLQKGTFDGAIECYQEVRAHVTEMSTVSTLCIMRIPLEVHYIACLLSSRTVLSIALCFEFIGRGVTWLITFFDDHSTAGFEAESGLWQVCSAMHLWSQVSAAFAYWTSRLRTSPQHVLICTKIARVYCQGNSTHLQKSHSLINSFQSYVDPIEYEVNNTHKLLMCPFAITTEPCTKSAHVATLHVTAEQVWSTWCYDVTLCEVKSFLARSTIHCSTKPFKRHINDCPFSLDLWLVSTVQDLIQAPQAWQMYVVFIIAKTDMSTVQVPNLLKLAPVFGRFTLLATHMFPPPPAFAMKENWETSPTAMSTANVDNLPTPKGMLIVIINNCYHWTTLQVWLKRWALKLDFLRELEDYHKVSADYLDNASFISKHTAFYREMQMRSETSFCWHKRKLLVLVRMNTLVTWKPKTCYQQSLAVLHEKPQLWKPIQPIYIRFDQGLND